MLNPSGTIIAGTVGYVALLGASVDNQGVIAAQLGNGGPGGGRAITLDVAGDGLLNVSIDTGAVSGAGQAMAE